MDLAPGVDRLLQDLLYDPQTSGGLLICVAEGVAMELLAALQAGGIAQAAIIGEVLETPVERIVVV